MQRCAMQFRCASALFVASSPLLPAAHTPTTAPHASSALPPSSPLLAPLPRCTGSRPLGTFLADAAHAKGTKAVQHKIGDTEKSGTRFQLAFNYLPHRCVLHWSIYVMIFRCCRRLFSCVWPSVLPAAVRLRERAGGREREGSQGGGSTIRVARAVAWVAVAGSVFLRRTEWTRRTDEQRAMSSTAAASRPAARAPVHFHEERRNTRQKGERAGRGGCVLTAVPHSRVAAPSSLSRFPFPRSSSAVAFSFRCSAQRGSTHTHFRQSAVSTQGAFVSVAA
jgi:hypothetical protein